MKSKKMITALALTVVLTVMLAVPALAAVYEQDLSQGVEGCTGVSHKDGADSWNVVAAWKQYINRTSDSLEQGIIDPQMMVKWLVEPNCWVVVEYDCAGVPVIQTQETDTWAVAPDVAAYAYSGSKAVFRMEDLLASYAGEGLDPAQWGNISVRSPSEDDVLTVSKVTIYISEEPDLSGLTINEAAADNNPVTETGDAGNKEVTTNPKTGDSALLICAIAALALSATAILFMKKRAEA